MKRLISLFTIFAAAIFPNLAAGQSTNFVLVSAKDLFDKSLRLDEFRESCATNSRVAFIRKLKLVPGEPAKAPEPEFSWHSGLSLSDLPAANWIEEAIRRGDMVTERYECGRFRLSDNFCLWVARIGKGTFLDWFVDNEYPGRTGDIGKDLWLVGFKCRIVFGGVFARR